MEGLETKNVEDFVSVVALQISKPKAGISQPLLYY